MAVYYKRNTDLYISKVANASANATNTVQLNVKDFSFNQSSNSVEVGRETLDPTQERTVDPYISVISPVNFTFTTYILSTVDTNVVSPEDYLWISLIGAEAGLTTTPTQSTIDFADGNVAELHNLTLWFDQPTQSEGSYRIDNAIIDSADIKFDINGLAEIEWSGRGLSLNHDNTPPASTDRRGLTNFIKNRFTTMTLNMNSVSYTLALTGGSIKVDNKVQFYGRNKMGETTVPVGHYTGNRSISGNLDFYMKSGTSESVDLFNEILTQSSNSDYESTHLAEVNLYLGGATKTPRLRIQLPQTLLEFGRQDFGEVLQVSIPFKTKEEASNYCSINYVN